MDSKLMRLLLTLCCLIGALVSPAFAQTTFTSGDCNANVTISGDGLTLTSTQAGNFVGCRASVGKQSGLLYFEATVNHALVATTWGVAGGGVGTILPSPVSFWSTAAGYAAGNNMQAAVLRADGSQYWNNVAVTGGAAVTSGKTIGIAINMNTDPREMWVTSDVTGTSGFGGGPLWNGSNTKSPTLPGTGNPVGVFPSGSTAGTGASFYILGDAIWPIWQGQVLDSSTFNFGATSFVGTIPSGFTAWDNASGNLAYPGPTNPLVINISNAPGFLISTSYSSGARVNAGAGWNGSAYTDGQPVCVFGLVTPGTSGTDPTVFNAACASGTPSGVGGIPGGSWPGATTVTSGGATFALLSRIDYVTPTHAFADAPAWTPSTQYPAYTYVQNGGVAYSQFNPFGSPGICTSGSGSGPPASDGTCNWQSVGRMTYSSGAAMWPHMKGFGSNSQQYNYNVSMKMWYGGSAQQIYGPQQTGEALGGATAIMLAFHHDLPGDQDFYCLGGYGIASRNNGCPAWSWSLTAAPGDGFADNSTGAPLRIDQTKGVTIVNTTSTVVSVGWNATAGEAFVSSDNNGIISRLQMLSTNGTTAPWHGGGGNGLFPGNGHGNGITIKDSIMQSGPNGNGVFVCDGGCAVLNSVIIDGSTLTGNEGIEFGYGQAVMANTTVVGTGATNSTCVMNQDDFGNSQHLTFYNNLCIGFSFPWGTRTGNTWVTPDFAANNATDSPSGGYGGTYTGIVNGINATSGQMPGVNISAGCTPPGYTSGCAGLTAANQLVNPTIGGSFDARIKSALADIYGAGAFYSTIQSSIADGSSPTPVTDILGQTWSPRYDIGPVKFQGAAPPASVLRLHFGLGHTW
jgi:hypothetical protein